MSKLYVMEIVTDEELSARDLDDLEQVVIDFLTPETATRVSVVLAEDE